MEGTVTRTSKKEFETVEQVLEEYLPEVSLEIMKAEDEEQAATAEARKLLRQFRESLEKGEK